MTTELRVDSRARPAVPGKANRMQTMERIRGASEDSWIATGAALLPLWLITISMLGVGEPSPPPPIPAALATGAFLLAIAASGVLLWKGWLQIDLLVCSLQPILLMIFFDEIHAAYKSPLTLVCTLILTAGIIGAQRSGSVKMRWLILLLAVAATWAFAFHAVENYWHLVGSVYGACFPDAEGCPPLASNATPWWALVFLP